MKHLLKKFLLELLLFLLLGWLNPFPCYHFSGVYVFISVNGLPGHFNICFLFSYGDKTPCSRSAP